MDYFCYRPSSPALSYQYVRALAFLISSRGHSCGLLEDRMDRKLSVKKTLGTFVVVGVLLFSGYAVFREPAQIETVLWPLIVLAAALFGIKTIGGVMLQNGQKQNGNTPYTPG